MDAIVWEERYSIGSAEIDEQHQKLFAILNELINAMRHQVGQEITASTIAQLQYYAATHFATEEKYMTEYKFPGLSLHQKKHQEFTSKIEQFQSDVSNNKTLVTIDIMKFLGAWLQEHILHTDKEYQAFFQAKGIEF